MDVVVHRVADTHVLDVVDVEFDVGRDIRRLDGAQVDSVNFCVWVQLGDCEDNMSVCDGHPSCRKTLTIHRPQSGAGSKIHDNLDIVWNGGKNVASIKGLQHHVVHKALPLLLSFVVGQHVAVIAVCLVAATKPIAVLADAGRKGEGAVERAGRPAAVIVGAVGTAVVPVGVETADAAVRRNRQSLSVIT